MKRKRALPPELLQRLADFGTATVADAVDSFRVRAKTDGFASLELRCFFPELPPMVGFAITCTADSTSPRLAGRVSRRRELYEALRDAPKPAVVVCQSVGVDRLRTNHFGDIMSTTFQRLGAVGAVSDAGVRDVSGIRERAPGFQVFAAGTVPASGEFVIVEVGVTVSVCDLTVSPGDLLHGDAEGLITVPLSVAANVPDRSELILRREAERVSLIQRPDFTLEALFPPR